MDTLQQIAGRYGVDAALLVCGLRHSLGVNNPQLPWGMDGLVPDDKKIHALINGHDLPHSVLKCPWLSSVLPADVARRCIDQQRLRALQSLARCEEMVSIHENLVKSGFDVRFWKGLALSMLLHGDLTTRPSRDIDLLVKPEELLSIRRSLMAMGYEDVLPLDESRIPMYMRLHREWVLARPMPGGYHTYVELQTSPALYWSIPDSARGLAFRGIRLLDLAGRRVPVPEPTIHCLLIVMHHGLSEGWRQLRQVSDLALFVMLPTGTIDWQQVMEISRNMDCHRALFVGLGLVRDLAGVPIPEMFHLLVDRESSLIATAKSRLLKSPLPPKSELSAGAMIWQWCLLSNTRSRLRFILGQLRKRISPGYPELQTVRLPRGMHLLYYLLKPIRPLLRGSRSSSKS